MSQAEQTKREKARKAATGAKPLWNEDGERRGILDKYDEQVSSRPVPASACFPCACRPSLAWHPGTVWRAAPPPACALPAPAPACMPSVTPHSKPGAAPPGTLL